MQFMRRGGEHVLVADIDVKVPYFFTVRNSEPKVIGGIASANRYPCTGCGCSRKAASTGVGHSGSLIQARKVGVCIVVAVVRELQGIDVRQIAACFGLSGFRLKLLKAWNCKGREDTDDRNHDH